MEVHEVLQRLVARAIVKLEHGEVGIDEKVVSEALVHVPHIEEPLQVSKHRVRFRTVQLGRLHDPDMVSLGQLLLLERLNLGDAPAVIALGMIEGERQDLERVRMHRVHVLQAPVEELGVVAYPRGVDYHGDVSLEIVELEPLAGGVPRSQFCCMKSGTSGSASELMKGRVEAIDETSGCRQLTRPPVRGTVTSLRPLVAFFKLQIRAVEALLMQSWYACEQAKGGAKAMPPPAPAPMYHYPGSPNPFRLMPPGKGGGRGWWLQEEKLPSLPNGGDRRQASPRACLLAAPSLQAVMCVTRRLAFAAPNSRSAPRTAQFGRSQGGVWSVDERCSGAKLLSGQKVATDSPETPEVPVTLDAAMAVQFDAWVKVDARIKAVGRPFGCYFENNQQKTIGDTKPMTAMNSPSPSRSFAASRGDRSSTATARSQL
ncbi:hypothetical protein THAOC_07343 [Thalassiosira oceanica]|uniref:Uncharacterized protein n=1 Tax=Thalassiosira oceanica TaxID=159749 RepID=K0SXU6_THAOC|nr:hypothetical protein THAOC_07343 [Thalassiosira oceanica]|eukprot:EJK71238.1 hypothetical protein THAOC_07343 [Thalassiosira oceanica]